MARVCNYCGQEIKAPSMSEAEYRQLLKEIGVHRGDENRIVYWLNGIEREHGIREAIFTLEDYMSGG